MYIHGLIPRIFANLAEAVLIALYHYQGKHQQRDKRLLLL